MQRRTFVGMATGATMALALKPGALASEPEPKIRFPIPIRR